MGMKPRPRIERHRCSVCHHKAHTENCSETGCSCEGFKVNGKAVSYKVPPRTPSNRRRRKSIH